MMGGWRGQGFARPFKYVDKGNMATIGHSAALADPTEFRVTLYPWLRSLEFTNHRAERIITVE